MPVNIIDKRFTQKDGSIVNRQKFIKRYKTHIKEAIRKAVDKEGIKDFKFRDKKIQIKTGGDSPIDLPNVQHDRDNGVYDYVHVGNKKFRKGDKPGKPRGGNGQGRDGSPDGGGEDNFEFSLSQEEFAQLFFEDLELPEMVKKQFIGDTTETQRCGFSTAGSPSSLSIKQTIIRAFMRRIALTKKQKEKEAEVLAEDLPIAKKKIHFIDDVDLRFVYRDRVDVPSSKAVMVCLMDVSGSMGEKEKDIAKRFYILLSMFLHRNYDNVDIIFIRHAEWAEECDEDTFFHGKESGGTIVSKGYEKTIEVLKQRYNPEQWNIYIAQASDGDNYGSDNEVCANLLTKFILPITQYFAYIEIGSYRHKGQTSDVFSMLDKISKDFKNLQARVISDYNEIFSVFRSLFKKER